MTIVAKETPMHSVVKLADAKRSPKWTDSQTEPGSDRRSSQHASDLVLRQVAKAYRIDGKRLPVLEDINLTVEPGQFVTIVGASGCGKSTLLRLISGLERDFDGEILVSGRNVTGPSLNRGLIFQDHRLFPWLSVEDNVALAFESRRIDPVDKRRIIQEHLKLVGLTGFEKAFPYQLSGGMAQRAAIARALVNEPEILLLDEPLGAVDALTRLYLQNELQRIWTQKGVTMIMVTHDIDEALFLGDRVVVLQSRPGRVRRIIDVDLPHPRDREDRQIARLKKEILADLAGEH